MPFLRTACAAWKAFFTVLRYRKRMLRLDPAWFRSDGLLEAFLRHL